MRNEANSRPGRVGRGRWMLYKQTQFPPDQHDGQVLYEKGLMVHCTIEGRWQNKANFGASAGWTQGPVVQTNPIPAAAPIGIGLPNAEVCVWGPRSAFAGADCAKRSQFLRGKSPARELESAPRCRPRERESSEVGYLLHFRRPKTIIVSSACQPRTGQWACLVACRAYAIKETSERSG